MSEIITLLNGDCLVKMPTLSENSVDSIITDPPYGLSFMGKNWDHGLPGKEFWVEALRVAKPGAHLLAFGGTRTFHRLTCAIEDAGWEVRDVIMWVYGSGMPKGFNIGKAIGAQEKYGKSNPMALKDLEQEGDGEEYQMTGTNNGIMGVKKVWDRKEYKPETENEKKWTGWNTALKPAWEPIIIARKPFEGNVAENVLKHGTGGINVGECKIGNDEVVSTKGMGKNRCLNDDNWKGIGKQPEPETNIGRFPSNLIHDGSKEVTSLFPDTGVSAGGRTSKKTGIHGTTSFTNEDPGFGDSGTAARFFYCAKASKADRDAGLSSLELQAAGGLAGRNDGSLGSVTMSRNVHPTVKPCALMRYLCKLVTPKGGTVMDPFMGSGSTGKAARREGMNFVGIEMSEEYFKTAELRIKNAHIEDPIDENREEVVDLFD
jgi:DNA modification methylase